MTETKESLLRLQFEVKEVLWYSVFTCVERINGRARGVEDGGIRLVL